MLIFNHYFFSRQSQYSLRRVLKTLSEISTNYLDYYHKFEQISIVQ